MPVSRRSSGLSSAAAAHLSGGSRVSGRVDPGPYEAIIVSHLDPQYMGTLRVELLKKSAAGNNPERTGQLLDVRYLSPFYGVTAFANATQNDGYQHTQKSYGFWAVPPDVGSRVLVIFAEGDISQGFWIGCVQDRFMNFMVPDSRASTELTTDITPGNLKGKKLPVGEYNKKLPQSGGDPTKFKKPYNKDYTEQLLEQGLVDDQIRGITSTSARREVPSMVFGFSTPGPLDKRGGAPKGKYGEYQEKADIFVNRLGGSSFVMDDGDDKFIRKKHPSEGPVEYVNVESGGSGGDPTIPYNELVRLRTRTGHQILLHNSEDLIYIANARGTAWIELTSDGKIDIHAEDSISIQTETDINITAERDINFEAGRNINMRATARQTKDLMFDTEDENQESGRIQIESRYNFNLDVGANATITTHTYDDNLASQTINGNLNLSVAGNRITHIGRQGTDDIDTSFHYDHTLITGEEKHEVTETSHTTIKKDTLLTVTEGALDVNVSKYIYQTSGGDFDVNSGGHIYNTSASSNETKAGGNIIETAPQIHMNGPGAATATKAAKTELPETALLVTPLGLITLPRVTVGMTDDDNETVTYDSILPRAPQHEPWPQHEHRNPLAYKYKKTDRELITSLENEIPVVIEDTFQKSGAPASGQFTSNTAAPPTSSTMPPGGVTRKTANPVSSTVGEPFQGEVPGTVDGLSEEETRALLGALGQRESGNDYTAVNSIGYVGKYQFGAAALETLGYVKPGTYNRGNSALNDPSVWTGKGGVNNVQEFLENKNNVQEVAMIENTNFNKQALLSRGAITEDSSNEHVAGMLAGSHLLGAGGMNKWRNGQGGADAYGTTGDEYYALGKSSLGGVG